MAVPVELEVIDDTDVAHRIGSLQLRKPGTVLVLRESFVIPNFA